MPVFSGPSNGGAYSSSAAFPLRFQIVVFAGAGAINSNDLFADGTPGLRLWVQQTIGPGAITVQPQFADGRAANLPDWQNLVPGFPVALNIPSLTQYSLGTDRFRVRLTSTGVATVRFRLTSTLS